MAETLRTIETQKTDRYNFMMQAATDLGALAWNLIEAGDIRMKRKPDTSIVTTADKALNREFIERVEARYPGDLVWGEEESNSEKGDTQLADEHWMWLIDPIDGTSGFWRSYQNHRFRENTSTIMITGFAPGETAPTMSVIHNPFQDQKVTISANDNRTFYHTSDTDFPPPTVHLSEKGPQTLADVQRFEQNNWHDCEPDLSSMQKHIPLARATNHQIFMGSVALGDTHLSAFPGPSNPHDVAPGALIVHNAGGTVMTFAGEDYSEVDWRVGPIAGTICTPNPQLAKEFVARYSKQ